MIHVGDEGGRQGADARAGGTLKCYVPFRGQQPFRKAAFDQYRGTYWGRSDEAAARST